MITAEEDLSFRTYSPVLNYRYDRWFQSVEYNGRTLNDEERKDFVKVIDETVSSFTSGLPLLTEELKRTEDLKDDYHIICRIVYSVSLFVVMTMCDCMVAGKYFILADTDYDKRFMRGKMKVILNEGFKKLYGYKEVNKKKSEWFRLLDLMKFFPEIINRQYQDLTYQLENQSKISSWWKDERDYETHIDSERLYDSRMVEIEESKEMMETLRLDDALFAVNHFLTNAHACLRNYLVEKYRRGEIKEA
ncbi:MAG: hypothetical protein II423_01700 [Erysipelotrichaceae bacterium]|nr:hypothetical protein [Erysipelotrichaceae bacterium]